MYIKKIVKKNKTSDKEYITYRLVESYRTEKGPRQRVLLNLGKINVSEDQFKALANRIETIVTGQQQLFPVDSNTEKEAQKISKKLIKDHLKEEEVLEIKAEKQYIPADINSVEVSDCRTYGAEIVCHEFWKRLGFNEILKKEKVPETVIPIIEALIVGRLISPGSERHTQYWSENLSSIFELTEPALRKSLSSFYRAGDRLLAIKDNLETQLAINEQELFSLNENLILMDLTNTHFEGEMAQNSKAARGHSKQKRSDCKLLTLALIVDENGFPKCSKFYPGNQSEFATFKEMMNSLIEAYNFTGKRTVVMDKGIASRDNIEYIKEINMNYVVISREKHSYQPGDDMSVIKENEKNGQKIEVKRYETPDETHLFCKSAKIIKKEEGIRSQKEKILIERLEYLKSGLSKKNRTKKYEKIIEKTGVLKDKYSRVAKFYEINVIPDDKKAFAKDIIWKKIEEKYGDAEKNEGCYLLKTNVKNFSDEKIWKIYTTLTRIENSFRAMKSFLGARPNFHQTEERADTHFFISVLGYHILNAIEYSLSLKGDNRNWGTIRNVLSSHTLNTVSFDVIHDNHKKRFQVRTPGIPEECHNDIYEALDISPDTFKRKQAFFH